MVKYDGVKIRESLLGKNSEKVFQLAWTGKQLAYINTLITRIQGDMGNDIDEKKFGKIFDPFFTTKEKGIGLRLSIAHKITDQLKGKLTAINQ